MFMCLNITQIIFDYILGIGTHWASVRFDFCNVCKVGALQPTAITDISTEYNNAFESVACVIFAILVFTSFF